MQNPRRVIDHRACRVALTWHCKLSRKCVGHAAVHGLACNHQPQLPAEGADVLRIYRLFDALRQQIFCTLSRAILHFVEGIIK